MLTSPSGNNGLERLNLGMLGPRGREKCNFHPIGGSVEPAYGGSGPGNATMPSPKLGPASGWAGVDGTENFPVPPFSRQVGRISPRPTFRVSVQSTVTVTVGRIFLRRPLSWHLFQLRKFTNLKASSTYRDTGSPQRSAFASESVLHDCPAVPANVIAHLAASSSG